jgi:tetratricopeptide (TPR) repeat protein
MDNIGQPTILLADSDVKLLDKNANLLQEMGLFNHLHAENGSEAIAMIKNFNPNIIILSQDLPDINGLSILTMIRQMEDQNRTVVVIYGEKINDRLLAKAGRIGVDGIIMAPYDDATFKKLINESIFQPLDEKFEQAEQLNEKCQAQINSGKFEEALETCNDILELHDNAEVYYNMGYILSRRGDLEEALKNFKRATLINNQHARAFKQMGLIYKMLGKTEDAQDCLEHAAELHMVMKQDSEAEEILNTVLTLRPDTTNVYNSLGIIYRRQGRLKEAVSAYEKAMRVHPEDENIYFNIARAYIELNEITKAQKALKQALQICPTFEAAVDLLRATELGLKLKT